MNIPESERIPRDEAYGRIKVAHEDLIEAIGDPEEINPILQPEAMDAAREYLDRVADAAARSGNPIIEDAAAQTVLDNVPGLTKTSVRAALSYKINERSREIPIEALENEA